jgi:TetR/AcrR family transcriptional regulator, ethionamide resistance regulator
MLDERALSDVDIDELAAAAGLSRSSFCFYFPTLGDAVAALVTEAFATLVSAGSDWYERDDLPPRERVERGLTATVNVWREHARTMAALRDATSTKSAAQDLWRATLEHLELQASQRIRRDKSAGLITSKLEADELAHVLVGMTVAAMDSDVMSIVRTGAPRTNVADVLIHVWSQSLYGT